MKALLLILGLLVVGCGPQPPCVVKGVTFLGQEGSHGQEYPEGWTCPRFALAIEVMGTMFDKYQPTPAFRRENYLRAIDGYAVSVKPEGSWYSEEAHKMIQGQTWCIGKNVVVNKYPPNESDTLIHEFIHVTQRCMPSDHSDWNLAGRDGMTINNMKSKTFTEMQNAFDFFPY